MKKNKILKLTFIILVIILLSMVSFIGIYVQNKNEIVNILPEYLLAKDLKGYRRIELKVSDKIAETIKYDAEGQVITDENTEVARTEEKKVNEEEILTEENYKIVKEMIEKRLKKMQVKDYIIRQDKTTGNMIIEIPENKNTDRVVGQLSMQGKFEIIDNETKEVLMTNEDVKSVKSGYGTTSNGATAIFINLQFNKEGTEKFKKITNTYIQTTVTKEATEEGKEPEEETVTKEIAIKIDDSTLLTTYFDEEVSNGLLQLSVGSSSSSTTEELQEYLLEANSMAALLDSGKMPIVYEVEQNKFVFSDITNKEKGVVISSIIILLTIGMIYFIIKYKTKGILGSISFVGYIAIYLIALRYFNVEISIGGIVGIIISIALSYTIMLNILKQKEIMPTIKKYTLVFITTLIIAIVFTFMNIGMGITLFWGIVISLLYHLSVTNMMLKD